MTSQFQVIYYFYLKLHFNALMNDFPVIGDTHRIMVSPGANIASRYKEMYNVELFLREKNCLWTKNAAFCRGFMGSVGDYSWCIQILSFFVGSMR